MSPASEDAGRTDRTPPFQETASAVQRAGRFHFQVSDECRGLMHLRLDSPASRFGDVKDHNESCHIEVLL